MLVAGWGMRAQTATAQSNAEHYVIFEGPINDTNTSRLMSIVGSLIPKGLKELHLVVGTGGGSISDALLTYGFLRALPVNVTTYNLSRIASSGSIIYLAGEKRVVAPSGFFQFHHVTQNFSRPPTSMTVDELTDEKTSLGMSLDRMEQIYRDRTLLAPTQIEEFRRHAVFFDAEAAHNAGIADEVAVFHIPPGAALSVVNSVQTETPR